MKGKTRRTYSKQNRPITSCSECTRRKQRCDRNDPCRRCVERGDESKCLYNHLAQSTDRPLSTRKKHKSHACSPYPETETRISRKENDGLSEQLGYLQNGANALSFLDQLLHNGESQLHTTDSTVFGPCISKKADFWRIVDSLPPIAVWQGLVQSFFSEANWYFAVLDQYFFETLMVQWIACYLSKDLTDSLSLELSHFPSLLFQVFALALQFLPPGHPYQSSSGVEQQKNRDALSGKFSEQGENILGLLGRHPPSITSVQADLMRCAWLKNDGCGAKAWYSLGRAVRQAQELGLHIQVSDSLDQNDTTVENLKALWYAEHKRRLWVTLFTWESHMSLQLGRPRMIHISDCTLENPIDCDFPLEPARTLFRLTGHGDRPSSYTLQLVKYKIGHLIHRMLSTGATNSLFEDSADLESLHEDVLKLLESLPPSVRIKNPDTSWDFVCPGLVKQRLQISMVAYAFIVALHRHHAIKNASSRQKATDAAIHSLEALHELFKRSETYHYKIYTLVFYTIDIGIFLAAVAIEFYTDTSDIRKRIEQTLEQAVMRLDVLKDRNSAARCGGVALKKCIQKYRQIMTKSSTIDIDSVSGGWPSTRPTLAGTRSFMEFLPEETAPSIHGAEMEATFEQDLILSPDLFDDIMNARISTNSWLENVDTLAALDFQFDETNFTWDSLLG